MIEMEQAIAQAREVLPRAFPESAAEELRLEVAEKTDDEQFWHVTFSYPRQNATILTNVREYRTIKLRTENGGLIGVRNGLLVAA